MSTYSAMILATPGLVGYWQLNESSGTVFDATGAANGTVSGSITRPTTGIIPNQPTDSAYDFTAGAVTIANVAAHNVNQFTVECWINMDTMINSSSIVSRRDIGAGTGGFTIDIIDPVGNITFYTYIGGFANLTVSGWTAGTTWHLVCVYDGAARRIYRNGVQVGTNAASGTLGIPATPTFMVGTNPALLAAKVDGRIDDISYYNVALDAATVLAHYNAGISAPAAAASVAPYKAQGPTEATIALPGWGDQRLIPISPPSMSWRTDGPGSFECTVDNRTLMKHELAVIGVSSPLKGRWLWWEHPTAGAWGGVITSTDSGKWTTRIVAEQFAVLLRKRRTNVNLGNMSMSPGSLALIFMTGAERNGDSYMLTSWTAEECGAALEMQPRGGDLCDDILPQLAAFGYQWRVKATTMNERAFEFRSRLGIDKRGSVMLSDGRHIVSINSTGDLWTVANSIIGVAGDSSFQEANGYQLDDDRSIRTLGRRYEATIAYTGVVTRSTIVPLVKADLKERRYAREIYTAEVVDEDSIWSQFREGDVISIASASLNYQGPMDVDIRSLDMSQQLMTIAGQLRWQDLT